MPSETQRDRSIINMDSSLFIEVLLHEIDPYLVPYVIYFFEDSSLLTELPSWLQNKKIIKQYLTHTALFNKQIRSFNFLGEKEDVFWNEDFGIETGENVLIEKIIETKIDPNYVLVFRRAPLEEEYHRFWTNDFYKVKYGLNNEITANKKLCTKI